VTPNKENHIERMTGTPTKAMKLSSKGKKSEEAYGGGWRTILGIDGNGRTSRIPTGGLQTLEKSKRIPEGPFTGDRECPLNGVKN